MIPLNVKSVAKILVISFGFFLLGFFLRIFIQPVMGPKVVWLTFYPAIMFSALLGGFVSGCITGFLSVLFAYCGPSLIGVAPYIMDWTDGLGAAVFYGNTLMISFIARSVRIANEKSRRAQVAAEKANQAKSLFLAQMSHELRTPFNALLGFTNILLTAKDTTPAQLSTLKIISRSANHLLELINNVLDMSRLENRRHQIFSKPFSIREMILDVVSLMEKRCEEKGLQIRAYIDKKIPAFVMGDVQKFRQILINLVGNSIKFSDNGSIDVTLNCFPHDKADKYSFVLIVKDEGCGIDDKYHDLVFQPFQQVEQSSDRGGTGLGLAIVKQFVEAMSGSIMLSSALGKGTKITLQFELPKAPDFSSETKEAALTEESFEQAGIRQSKKFLIVDDNADNRLLLQHLMERMNQDCRTANNGLQAVQLFCEYGPDLVWMDIRMEVMDGIEAMKRIRELPQGDAVKIIAVTASVFDEEKEKLVEEGFDDVLYKPFPMQKLKDILVTHLNFAFVGNSGPAESAPSVDKVFGTLDSSLRNALLAKLKSLDPDLIDDFVNELKPVHPEIYNAVLSYTSVKNYAGLKNILEKTGSEGKE